MADKTERMSAAHYRKLLAEPAAALVRAGGGSESRPPKYSNEAIVVDGERFDSKLEARRYEQLKLMRQAGLIRYFLRQVPFVLAPGSRFYVDFMLVLLDGTLKYEDTKGVLTDVARTKINTVEHLYGVKIYLLDRAAVGGRSANATL